MTGQPLEYAVPANQRRRRWWLWGVVVALGGIAVLSVVLLTMRWYVLRRARQMAVAAADLQMLSTAVDAFGIDAGRVPTAAEGLNVLVAPPLGAGRWTGPYVRSLKADPWGRAYIYMPAPTPGGTGYVVLSAGPDGKPGTPDDIAVGPVPPPQARR